MKCNKFKVLDGCSKCSCSLNDSRYIPLLDAISIADIMDVIMKQCATNTTTTLLLSKSTIDCTGNVNIVYDSTKFQGYTQQNRYICYKFIHIWLKFNKSQIYNAMQTVYLVLCAAILSCNEKEQKAFNLISNLETLVDYIQRYITILNKSNIF